MLPPERIPSVPATPRNVLCLRAAFMLALVYYAGWGLWLCLRRTGPQSVLAPLVSVLVTLSGHRRSVFAVLMLLFAVSLLREWAPRQRMWDRFLAIVFGAQTLLVASLVLTSAGEAALLPSWTNARGAVLLVLNALCLVAFLGNGSACSAARPWCCALLGAVYAIPLPLLLSALGKDSGLTTAPGDDAAILCEPLGRTEPLLLVFYAVTVVFSMAACCEARQRSRAAH